jgi:hypothetical protein
MSQSNLFTSGNNRLPVLAHEIRLAHEAALSAAKYSAERALEAGNLLLEAKASVGHGQWLAWLEKNVGISERTAQRYMALARSGIKSDTVADLGMASALERVSRQKLPKFTPGSFTRLVAGEQIDKGRTDAPPNWLGWFEHEAFLWSEDGRSVMMLVFLAIGPLPRQKALVVIEMCRQSVPADRVRAELEQLYGPECPFPLHEARVLERVTGSDLKWLKTWCAKYPGPVQFDMSED